MPPVWLGGVGPGMFSPLLLQELEGAAVVGDVDRAVRADRRAVRAAAGLGDDVLLRPSGVTRVSVWPSISVRTTEPSAMAIGPSGN